MDAARGTRRAIAFALLLACGGVAPSPDDNVTRLTGTFSCRSVPAAQAHYVGRQAGDTIDVSGDVEPAGGAPYVTDDRYRYDRKNFWDVKTDFGSSREFDGTGRPWSGDRWEVLGHGPEGADEHMTMELLAGSDFRRTYAFRDADRVLVPYRVDLCVRGDVPPPPSTCVVAEFPARTIDQADVKSSLLPPGATGSVTVSVALDAAGTVTGARIVHSDDPRLNAPALDAARRSRYSPPIHDCKPAAGTQIYNLVVTP